MLKKVGADQYILRSTVETMFNDAYVYFETMFNDTHDHFVIEVQRSYSL